VRSREEAILADWLFYNGVEYHYEEPYKYKTADEDHRQIAISGNQWPDDVRLSDLEPRFVCSDCGDRGADARPDFDWEKPGALMTGY
jgi:hypothetical protein